MSASLADLMAELAITYRRPAARARLERERVAPLGALEAQRLDDLDAYARSRRAQRRAALATAPATRPGRRATDTASTAAGPRQETPNA